MPIWLPQPLDIERDAPHEKRICRSSSSQSLHRPVFHPTLLNKSPRPSFWLYEGFLILIHSPSPCRRRGYQLSWPRYLPSLAGKPSDTVRFPRLSCDRHTASVVSDSAEFASVCLYVCARVEDADPAGRSWLQDCLMSNSCQNRHLIYITSPYYL